jgi:DNA-binding transcriptional LysR family regulator
METSAGLDAPDRSIETTLRFRQLVYFNEVIKQDFNISAAAQALYTSQPGVSRQLRELADELGVELFRHQGKRLIGLTEAGTEIARITARVLMEVRHIREVGQTYGAGRRNRMKVVATRHAASNLLHRAMVLAREQMPTLQVEVTEEDPELASAMLRAGEADLGLLTEAGRREEDLIYFPLERWQLLMVAPRGHPLCELPSIRLLDLTHYAICSY